MILSLSLAACKTPITHTALVVETSMHFLFISSFTVNMISSWYKMWITSMQRSQKLQSLTVTSNHAYWWFLLLHILWTTCHFVCVYESFGWDKRPLSPWCLCSLASVTQPFDLFLHCHCLFLLFLFVLNWPWGPFVWTLVGCGSGTYSIH